MPTTFRKDPEAILDYKFDWAAETNGTGESDWLDSGETISDYTITVDSGLTKESDSEASGAVTVWLSGGTVDERYKVTCEIDTSHGRTDQRTIEIWVLER